MKTGLFRLVVAGMMVAGVCVATAEEHGGARPKTEGATAKHRTEWKGVLSAPAAGAAADVVGVLTIKKGDTSKAYNLTSADAEVVAKIKDEATKGATVVVKGEANKDDTAIAVTKCMEPPKAAAAHHEKAAAATETK